MEALLYCIRDRSGQTEVRERKGASRGVDKQPPRKYGLLQVLDAARLWLRRELAMSGLDPLVNNCVDKIDDASLKEDYESNREPFENHNLFRD